MKKTTTILYFALSVLLLFSCDRDKFDVFAPDELGMPDHEFYAEKTGGNIYISYLANKAGTISLQNASDGSWVQLGATSFDADGSLSLLRPGETLRVGERIRVHVDIDCERDFDNMVLRDQRAAAFEPASTASGWQWNDGLRYYVDVRDEGVNCYIDHLGEGHYYVEYDLWVRHSGTFSGGICTLHSVYAPEFRANSSSEKITTEGR